MEYNEEEQKKMYIAYEEVRLSGAVNMFDRFAIKLTGLTEKQYSWVMNNYTKLKNKFGDCMDVC